MTPQQLKALDQFLKQHHLERNFDENQIILVKLKADSHHWPAKIMSFQIQQQKPPKSHQSDSEQYDPSQQTSNIKKKRHKKSSSLTKHTQNKPKLQFFYKIRYFEWQSFAYVDEKQITRYTRQREQKLRQIKDKKLVKAIESAYKEMTLEQKSRLLEENNNLKQKQQSNEKKKQSISQKSRSKEKVKQNSSNSKSRNRKKLSKINKIRNEMEMNLQYKVEDQQLGRKQQLQQSTGTVSIEQQQMESKQQNQKKMNEFKYDWKQQNEHQLDENNKQQQDKKQQKRRKIKQKQIKLLEVLSKKNQRLRKSQPINKQQNQSSLIKNSKLQLEKQANIQTDQNIQDEKIKHQDIKSIRQSGVIRIKRNKNKQTIHLIEEQNYQSKLMREEQNDKKNDDNNINVSQSRIIKQKQTKTPARFKAKNTPIEQQKDVRHMKQNMNKNSNTTVNNTEVKQQYLQLAPNTQTQLNSNRNCNHYQHNQQLSYNYELSNQQQLDQQQQNIYNQLPHYLMQQPQKTQQQTQIKQEFMLNNVLFKNKYQILGLFHDLLEDYLTKILWINNKGTRQNQIIDKGDTFMSEGEQQRLKTLGKILTAEIFRLQQLSESKCLQKMLNIIKIGELTQIYSLIDNHQKQSQLITNNIQDKSNCKTIQQQQQQDKVNINRESDKQLMSKYRKRDQYQRKKVVKTYMLILSMLKKINHSYKNSNQMLQVEKKQTIKDIHLLKDKQTHPEQIQLNTQSHKQSEKYKCHQQMQTQVGDIVENSSSPRQENMKMGKKPQSNPYASQKQQQREQCLRQEREQNQQQQREQNSHNQDSLSDCSQLEEEYSLSYYQLIKDYEEGKAQLLRNLQIDYISQVSINNHI